jgi:hypothetical protein
MAREVEVHIQARVRGEWVKPLLSICGVLRQRAIAFWLVRRFVRAELRQLPRGKWQTIPLRIGDE